MSLETESVAAVEQWVAQEAARCWPAILGSLSLRRSPCTRKRCHACATGEQHPSYVLYARVGGKRRAVYIPDELAPRIEQALANGRRLQALLFEAAPRWAKALKRERASHSARRGRATSGSP